ncbi:hypothetical protein GQ457_01G010320 [Hibiscus cannabinus]
MRVLCWNSIVNPRYILLSGFWFEDNVASTWINIYGFCNLNDQFRLWEELYELKKSWPQPWIVGGDFNAVRSKKERRGQGDRDAGIQEFNLFIDKCNLVEVPLVGRKFTWIGPGKRRSKLDRFLVDAAWFQTKDDLTLSGLNRNVSDHIPILLASWCINWGPKPSNSLMSGFLIRTVSR